VTKHERAVRITVLMNAKDAVLRLAGSTSDPSLLRGIRWTANRLQELIRRQVELACPPAGGEGEGT
jgi:hypothetical protein